MSAPYGDHIYPVGLLRGLNKLIHVEYLEQCLRHCKCCISNCYYYHYSSSRFLLPALEHGLDHQARWLYPLLNWNCLFFWNDSYSMRITANILFLKFEMGTGGAFQYSPIHGLRLLGYNPMIGYNVGV